MHNKVIDRKMIVLMGDIYTAPYFAFYRIFLQLSRDWAWIRSNYFVNVRKN
jgi:hypothetical protein